MNKYSFIFAISLSLVFSSCNNLEEEIEPSSEEISLSRRGPKANANNAFSTFKVRIENLGTTSTGFATPFSPGIWLVQKKNSAPIFISGQPDFGEGLEAIAEDGSPAELAASLQNDPKVRSHAAFAVPVDASGPAPIFEGQAYEFTLVAKPNDYLNFATMFIQSNDFFVGPLAQGISLFDSQGYPVTGDVTDQVFLWDAGTEVDEEPGIGPNQAPRQPGPNTGPDENGNVVIESEDFIGDLSEIIKVSISVL